MIRSAEKIRSGKAIAYLEGKHTCCSSIKERRGGRQGGVLDEGRLAKIPEGGQKPGDDSNLGKKAGRAWGRQHSHTNEKRKMRTSPLHKEGERGGKEVKSSGCPLNQKGGGGSFGTA